MTPHDLRNARQALGLSQRGLAEALHLSKNGARTIRLWEKDGNTVPGPVRVAVELMLEKHGPIKSQRTPKWLRDILPTSEDEEEA